MTTETTPETIKTLTLTLTAAREAITDASQVVMDAYETGSLIEVLLDDLCQHRLSYEESPADIDKEYLHIGEVCEHVTRLTRIMRAYGEAEKARGWTSGVGGKAAADGPVGSGTASAVADDETSARRDAGTASAGPERPGPERAAHRRDADGRLVAAGGRASEVNAR